VPTGLRSDPAGWTDPRHRRGLEAERRAIAFLLSRGWEVTAHRFRAGRSELDLVIRKGRLVAFVEVKARQGDGFGDPLEAVTGPKRRDLVRVARAWIDRFGRPGDVYRFDCIGVLGRRLEHVEDAFRPGWR
jgi:putative endonuclease